MRLDLLKNVDNIVVRITVAVVPRERPRSNWINGWNLIIGGRTAVN